MAHIFTTILNMSLTASIIILIVLLARLCLKKAPKIYSYLLWAVVLFRLLCPVSFSLPVSVLAPMSEASTSTGSSYTASMEYISVPERSSTIPPQHEHGLGENTTSANGDTEPVVADTPAVVVEQQTAKKPVGEIALTILGWMWAAGMAGVLGFTTWQTLSLKRKLDTAFLIRGNIFESEQIDTAFVLGVFNPKIYLPLDLPFDIQKAVVAHEQTHQRRGDHIVKLVSYAALAIHWFNPLVWLSFKLMCDDMEKSCDEAVLREMNNRGYSMKSIKKAYGNMLLVLGGGKQHIFSPVSFAENSTKSRVKNVVTYNSVAKSTATVLAVVCVLVAGVCVFNPAGVEAWADSVISESDVIASENIDQFHAPDARMIETKYGSYWSDTTELELYSDVSDLSWLKEFKHLNSLVLVYVNPEDWSEIENCEKLTKLKLVGYSDISLLEFFPNINCLILENNEITDLSPLKHCRQLEELELYGNENLSNYSVIGKLPNLKKLHISMEGDFAYESVVELKNLDRLEHLGLPYVEDISFLSNLSNLTGLSVEVRKQKEVDIIGSLSNLKNLGLFVNYAYGLDLSDSAFIHDDLARKKAVYGELEKIDLSPLKNLKNLESIDAEGYIEMMVALTHDDREDANTLVTTNLLESLSTEKLRKLRIFDQYGLTTEAAPLLSRFGNLKEIELAYLSENMNTEALTEIPDLRVIRIWNAARSSLDVSQIGRLTDLEHLQATGMIHGENEFSGLTNLKSLKLANPTDGYEADGNNDLSFCRNMKKLTRLEISVGEDGADLSGLSELTELKTLIMYGGKFDLSPLAGLENLETLCLTNEWYYVDSLMGVYLSKIYGEEYYLMDLSGVLTEEDLAAIIDIFRLDISALSELSKLKELSICGFVVDMSSLDNCDELACLYIFFNSLEDLTIRVNEIHIAQLEEFRSNHPNCYVELL